MGLLNESLMSKLDEILPTKAESSVSAVANSSCDGLYSWSTGFTNDGFSCEGLYNWASDN